MWICTRCAHNIQFKFYLMVIPARQQSSHRHRSISSSALQGRHEEPHMWSSLPGSYLARYGEKDADEVLLSSPFSAICYSIIYVYYYTTTMHFPSHALCAIQIRVMDDVRGMVVHRNSRRSMDRPPCLSPWGERDCDSSSGIALPTCA